MALAEQARGRLGEADALFEQSARAAAAMPSHYERALAELDRATMAARAGSKSRRWIRDTVHRAEKSLRVSHALADASRAAALLTTLESGPRT